MCVCGSKRLGHIWHQGKRSLREDVEIKEKGLGNYESNVMKENR